MDRSAWRLAINVPEKAMLLLLFCRRQAWRTLNLHLIYLFNSLQATINIDSPMQCKIKEMKR
jgi:hypothetical protein